LDRYRENLSITLLLERSIVMTAQLPPTFKPQPARISGPRVVIPAPRDPRPLVDVVDLGRRIDPDEYHNTVVMAQERARQRTW
jgi:hypothetical protein